MAGSDRRRNRLSEPGTTNATSFETPPMLLTTLLMKSAIASWLTMRPSATRPSGSISMATLLTDWPSETASLMLLSPISTPVYVLPMRRVFLSARCISCQNNPAYHVRMVGPANSVNAVAAAMAGPNGSPLFGRFPPRLRPRPAKKERKTPEQTRTPTP